MEIPNSLQNFHNKEITFPAMTTRPTKKSPTKINVITLSIPLHDARVIDLVLLTLGASLNFLIILTIVCKPSMRTSSNLYVVSLACSNMVILIEPLEEILKWSLDVNMKLNMDYVCMISFDVSVITLSILKFILYIGIFREQVSFGDEVLKKTTTLKGILLTWSSCIISIAIGLHIYDFFEENMADIYVWFTMMFIGMPVLTSIAIDVLIMYELYILKEIEGSWRMSELRQFVLLVVLSIAFLTIRTPYRLARAISFLLPKASCCTDGKREGLYFMAKAYPIAFSLIYIALSNDFHEIFQVILKYRCTWTRSKETKVREVVA